jgi:hypothetical protein
LTLYSRRLKKKKKKKEYEREIKEAEQSLAN